MEESMETTYVYPDTVHYNLTLMDYHTLLNKKRRHQKKFFEKIRFQYILQVGKYVYDWEWTAKNLKNNNARLIYILKIPTVQSRE